MAVVEHGEDTTTQMEAEEQAEEPGTAGLGKSVDKGDRPEDGSHAGVENDHHSRRRGRRREFSRHNDSKRSRSPEIWTRRGRGRADRPDVVCGCFKLIATNLCQKMAQVHSVD